MNTRKAAIKIQRLSILKFEATLAVALKSSRTCAGSASWPKAVDARAREARSHGSFERSDIMLFFDWIV